MAGGVDCAGLPEVDLVGRHQADACVMMVLVVPSEEAAAECAGLVDGLEPFWELRLIFQRLELGLRERPCYRPVGQQSPDHRFDVGGLYIALGNQRRARDSQNPPTPIWRGR